MLRDVWNHFLSDSGRERLIDHPVNGYGIGAAVAYAVGEIAGRLVTWIKPGSNVANAGLFAVTTIISRTALSLVANKLDNKTFHKYLNGESSYSAQGAALGLSFFALKLAGYSVSPWAVGANVAASLALNYLVEQA